MGKSDVSWLSWRRNTLGAKLHRFGTVLLRRQFLYFIRESNELHSLIEGSENGDNVRKILSNFIIQSTIFYDLSKQIEKTVKNRLKTAEALLKTADNLKRSAQYLSWFTTCAMEYNETLPEIEKVSIFRSLKSFTYILKDFTCSLVAQWVQEEVNKVQEHHKNCMVLGCLAH
uniref:Zinc finger MYM-type protein 1-like n=1 Tax=Meloidogyne hapla TaxID=6305 RepID=A0A1I8BNP2_MELHA